VNQKEMTADSGNLTAFYSAGASFKGQIIQALAAGGISVHSIKHTGDYHLVYIPTPQQLKNPEQFAAWKKKQPADGVPEASAAPAAPPESKE
jgi:hypothetical protein